MLAETTARLAFPLAALEAAGPLRSKAQLHMLAYVAQREFGDRMRAGRNRQEAWYDFGGGGSVPHSPLLDRDVAESPSLVGHALASPFTAEGRVYHSYRITEQGKARLDLMRAGAAPGVIDDMEVRIKGLCAGMPASLMENACGAFCPCADPAVLEARSRKGMAQALQSIYRALDGSENWRASLFGEILETVKEVLDETSAKEAAPDQSHVILCMSAEIVRRCSNAEVLRNPPDFEVPDPYLADVDDLASNLCQYCDKNGILKDPLTRPLEEVFSAEEVASLYTDLWKMHERPWWFQTAAYT